MEMRVFGRSGLRLSALGFGCGAVGGLMVRGNPRDQERTVGRALDAGVNYFDTAVQYGDGESEKNLGRALQSLKRSDRVIGTKVRLPPTDVGRIGDAIAQSLDGSLSRLRLDRVDICHLHNSITASGGGPALSVRQVLSEVVPAFELLRQAGKIRFLGLTAVGDTEALHQVIDSGKFDSAQVVYNVLNPSAASGLPANYPAQDYGRLLDRSKAAGTGVIGIRVLAGGALSGSAARHPIASPPPSPIGRAPAVSSRWSRRVLPRASPRRPRALHSRSRLSGRSWSASPHQNNSKRRSRRWRKVRCPPRRSIGCRRFKRNLPARPVDVRGWVDPGSGALLEGVAKHAATFTLTLFSDRSAVVDQMGVFG
jgi:L-galactose dehydrogenase/L-glyceraldehyde 3-phosphate reductase